jgi:predicted CXXCH cytochrome family protein
MKGKRTVAGFLLVLITLMLVYALERVPHKFSDSDCGGCHAKDSSGRVLGKKLNGPVLTLCERCHRDILSDGYIHPINVAPRQAIVPRDMPLSPEGTITCATCHDIHASYFTPYGTRSHFLRRHETGRKFCEACHKEPLQESGHRGILGEAHFKSKYVATSGVGEIDDMSRNCLSCHDGSLAPQVTVHVGEWVHQESMVGNDMGTHPIGVDYESARTAHLHRTDLVPIGLVDPRIKFFDGKVGCGSCHNPYSKVEQELVMSNRGSKLCLACHALDRR